MLFNYARTLSAENSGYFYRKVACRNDPKKDWADF